MTRHFPLELVGGVTVALAQTGIWRRYYICFCSGRMPFWLMDHRSSKESAKDWPDEAESAGAPSWWEMLRPQGPKAHRPAPPLAKTNQPNDDADN